MNALVFLHQLLIGPLELLLETVYGVFNGIFANSGAALIPLSLAVNFLLLPLIYTLSYLSLADDSIIRAISAWGNAIFLPGLIPLIFIVTTFKKHREAKAKA